MTGETSRRERRKGFGAEQRLDLLEDDMDEILGVIGEIRQGQSKLTAAALGLLISVVICTVSVLATVAVSK